jgi:excinuclease ABC subunit B
MRNAIKESQRRREKQIEFNKKNKITPKTIQKAIRDGIEELDEAQDFVRKSSGQTAGEFELNSIISDLEYEMELAARNLQFEKAAKIRDKIKELKKT